MKTPKEPVVEKSQVELCKEEIEAVLGKYPTVQLNVNHTIQVTELPKAN